VHRAAEAAADQARLEPLVDRARRGDSRRTPDSSRRDVWR
jgi:hypothetical protein